MSVALEVALRRHAAWASGQFDLAMGYIADEIVGEAPAGRIDGIAQYREFMEPLSRSLPDRASSERLATTRQPSWCYDTATQLVPSAPGAEYVR